MNCGTASEGLASFSRSNGLLFQQLQAASVPFDAVSRYPGTGISTIRPSTEWACIMYIALALLLGLTKHELPPLLQVEPDWLLTELLLDIWRLNLSQAVQVLTDVELIYGLHVQKLMD